VRSLSSVRSTQSAHSVAFVALNLTKSVIRTRSAIRLNHYAVGAKLTKEIDSEVPDVESSIVSDSTIQIVCCIEKGAVGVS
jgi:hypothetical protein